MLGKGVKLFILTGAMTNLGYYTTYFGQLIYFLDLRARQDKAFTDLYNPYLDKMIDEGLYPGCYKDPESLTKVTCKCPAVEKGDELVEQVTSHVESILAPPDTRLWGAAAGAAIGTVISAGFFMANTPNTHRILVQEETHYGLKL